MFGQKNWMVILLKPHELEIFGYDDKTSTILTLPLTIINNLEVLDRDELYQVIGGWAKTQTYQATDIVVLLSSGVIFEKTFNDSEKDKWDTLTLQFLDAVPFEETLSHIYTPSGGRGVVATNQELISALTQAFSTQGYQTKVVVPAKLQNVDQSLNSELVKKILGNMNQLYKDNMITPTEEKSDYVPGTNDAKGSKDIKKPKSQLPLLLSIFGILLAILAVVIYLNQ